MKNALTKVSNIAYKIQDYVWSASLTLGVCMCAMAAYADEKGAINETLKIIGKIVAIPALFYLIFGFVKRSEADSEGDGPAKSKAEKQIAGGITLLVIAILLHLNKIGDLISNFMLS